MANAKTTTIGPNNPATAVNDVLIAALTAASDNDVIILTDGIYNEYSNYIDFNKTVEVKAADGAKPVVNVGCYIKVRGGKHVTVKGIKFDGTEQGHNGSSYAYFIRVYDNAANTLELDNCEFCNTDDRVILVESDKHLDLLKINNCYFHDVINSAIHIGEASNSHACNRVEIKNSTFANFSGFGDKGLIQVYSKNHAIAENPDDDQELVVDHCTFYNISKISDDTYSIIDSRKTSKAEISNCIFANPATLPDGTYNLKASQLYGGSISNCLTYNVLNHRTDAVTPTGSLKDVDPLFNDLANNKYTYAGTYGVSMSPARGAGTDGSDLGDPRWYTPVTYPSTDFASGYTFTASKATLSGDIIYEEGGPDDPYLRYDAPTTPGYATWIIQATRACHVDVTVNMADNSWNQASDANYKNGNHIFGVELWDKSTNTRKDTVAEGNYGDGKQDGYSTYPTVNLGSLEIPAAGLYTVKLLNPRGWAKCGVESVTFTYQGGETVDIPNDEIPFEDAILGNGATRDLASNPNEIHFGSVSAYAKWNIHADADGIYSFTFDVVGSDYGKYNLLIKDSENSTIYDSFKGFSNSGSVTHSNILLDAGDYTIQVANVNTGSVGYLTNIAVTAGDGYFILNDNKENDGSIATADYDASGTRYNILLKRSFTAGRYYTLCVPVDLYHSLLASKFGEDYELWRMESAEQVGDEINLNFEKYVYDGENNNFEPGAGIPFLLKPSVDVENPVFSNKKVCNYTYNNTKSFTAADFVGTFYKDEIPAGENNLYLQNNNLYYSESSNTTIKGTRAWIRLKQQGAAPARARIVMGGKVATDINLVNGELVNGTVKAIENGQLILIRDGKKYNVMGARLQ